MLISLDRTDFPLVVVDDAAVEVQLLPVTKIQFEPYVTELSPADRTEYQEMLTLNPAVSVKAFTAHNREQLFATGILPQEASAFAGWVGQGFDLPTVTEWRAILAALRRVPPPRHHSLTDLVGGPAGLILEKISVQRHIRSMADYALLRGGLVEWVRDGADVVGLGAPRAEFQPNLWDPLVDVIRPVRHDKRLPYFGFRLVRRGDWYLAGKDTARYVF